MLTFFHQNIQSIGIKKLNFEVLTTNHPDLDISCVTEHWLNKDNFIFSTIILQIFHLSLKFCRKNKKAWWVMYYLLNNPWKLNLELNLEVFTWESSMVEFSHLKTIVICVARLPNSKILVFIENLDYILNELSEKSNSYGQF